MIGDKHAGGATHLLGRRPDLMQSSISAQSSRIFWPSGWLSFAASLTVGPPSLGPPRPPVGRDAALEARGAVVQYDSGRDVIRVRRGHAPSVALLRPAPGHPQAERVIVMMGSGAEAAHDGARGVGCGRHDLAPPGNLGAGEELTVDYRHLIGPDVEMPWLDAHTGRKITGFAWSKSLATSTTHLLDIVKVAETAVTELA